MTFDGKDYKHFFWKSLGMITMAVVVTVSTCMLADPFGLFRDPKGRALPVYGREAAAKYLMSYRYIPENFDGVIIGPSFSNVIDPRLLKPLSVYNISISGANTSELKPIAENLFRSGKIRFVIFCLAYYLTKDHGMKTNEINPKEYYRALGSIEMLMVLKGWLQHKLFNKPPVNDANGFVPNHSIKLSPEQILTKIRKHAQKLSQITVDEQAVVELKNMVDSAHAHHVQVFAYFHPYPEPRMALMKKQYKAYVQRISQLFGPNDVVIDMTNDKWKSFRSNLRNYNDWGHLNNKAGQVVTKILRNVCIKHLHIRNAQTNQRN